MSAVAERPPSASAPAPAALAAFVRGVERRALVLAELQCGNPGAGDAAVARALVAFRRRATGEAMTRWPRSFWSLLLAEPALRAEAPGSLPVLAALGPGPRAALLLRVGAGLEDAEAAAVLGLTPATYHLALQRALPQDAEGSPDLAVWQALQQHVQQAMRDLPSERVQALSRPAAPVATPAAPRAPRRLLAVLWTLLALCAVAFGLTFWPPVARWLGVPHITRQALPPPEEPASRYGADAGIVSNSDFDLLADPIGEARAADADFDAWLAAQSAAGAGLQGALAPLPPQADDGAGPPAAPTAGSPESSDAP